MAKKRLDVLMVEQGLAESRQKAQALIMAGQVFVGGRGYAKAGFSVDQTDRLQDGGRALRYVSRAGSYTEPPRSTLWTSGTDNWRGQSEAISE